MEQISNNAESFYREIRRVEIYDAVSFPYKDNFFGHFPDPALAKYSIPVIPEDYERKIPTKKKNGNHFFEVDLNFPLLDITTEKREKFYEEFNRTGFAVVCYSNVEKVALGNDREPLTIEFLDGIKDNASGNDQYNISVTGQTIINPKFLEI